MRFFPLVAWIILLIPLVSAGQTDSTERKARFGIYPVIGYTPVTNLQLGAITMMVFSNEEDKQNTYYRPTQVNPYIIYTLNNQLEIALDHMIFFGRDYMVSGDLIFHSYPNEYFGLGNNTEPNTSELVNDKYVQLTGQFSKIVRPEIFVGIRYDLQYNSITEIEPAGILASDNPTGINGGRNFGLGLTGQYDSRDNTLYPTQGMYLSASITQYGAFIGGSYTYTRYHLDLRKYIELLGPRNIIAFQLKGVFTSGSNIPFYKLPELGGRRELRGIANENLYRDRQMIYAQVEGRQHLFWRIGGTLWLGAGQVFNSTSSVSWDNTRIAYGLGGRFQAIKEEKMNIRVDLGFTDNGQHALYISIREAF